MSNLPLSWSSTPLSSIITNIQAGLNVKCEERPPEDGERGLIKISAVTWGKFDEDQSKTLPVDEVVDDRNLIRKGDLLISRANTIELVGSAVLVGDFSRRLYLSDKVLRLVMGDEFKRWVNYALKLPATRKAIQEASSGNQLSMRNISQDKLLGLSIPFAPLAEQTRIAEKLDTVLTRVDACRDRLARVAPLLKRFRQSVLAAATSGRLTEDWRNDSALWEVDIRLSSVGVVSGGLTKNSKRDSYALNRPYLRVANVHANELRLDDVSTIGLSEQEFEKTRLRSGDLLIVEGNGSLDQIGRVALWGNEIEDCSHQNHLIRWRAGSRILPKYALLFLLSPAGREQIVKVASSTTGLHTLSVSKIGALTFSLPGLAEQTEIVRRVETLFAFADRLEARLKTAQIAVDRLTPALLAKAFRGELVPQDPNDEPAAELLKRLAASRDAAPKAKRGRRSATADTTPCATFNRPT